MALMQKKRHSLKTIKNKEKLHKINSFGQNHWELHIMGKDERRGEREPKFLAINIFSIP